MDWVRVNRVGQGSFATISLAIPTKNSIQFPPLMAVKSSEATNSSSLKNEKEVLDHLKNCPHIINCFGDADTTENGKNLYNLLLEYASEGSLSDKLRNSGGKLPETDVRQYTRTILKGLRYIHSKGFVHCDIKLQNVLVFNNGEAKVADFGLAKRTGENRVKTEQKFEFRGTPLYMSPECVNDNDYESPCDIWALGCAVIEMITGKPAWTHRLDENMYQLFLRIGLGEELPEVPKDLSEEGKDFLSKCFVKDPRKRWTAEMLLNHPFVSDDHTVLLNDMDVLSTSPRCHFDFGEWDSPRISPESDKWFERQLNSGIGELCSSRLSSPVDRLGQLVTSKKFDWSVTDSWVTVRSVI